MLAALRSTATHKFVFVLCVRLGHSQLLAAEELCRGWELAGDFSASASAPAAHRGCERAGGRRCCLLQPCPAACPCFPSFPKEEAAPGIYGEAWVLCDTHLRLSPWLCSAFFAGRWLKEKPEPALDPNPHPLGYLCSHLFIYSYQNPFGFVA